MSDMRDAPQMGDAMNGTMKAVSQDELADPMSSSSSAFPPRSPASARS